VDTPELARGGAPAEPYAQAAADRAQELAFDRRVLITLQPHRPRDRYGRLLAYVGLEDGSVLNEVLISEGLAEADDRWSHRDLNRYALLEEQARVSGRGRWGE
jgi:micrococcal nuclease